MKWPFRLHREPTPPANVRLVCDDGRVVPMELVYLGKRQGLHRWRNATQVTVYSNFSLEVDFLPARTTIELDFRAEVAW